MAQLIAGTPARRVLPRHCGPILNERRGRWIASQPPLFPSSSALALIVLRLADVAGSPCVSMAVGAALVVAPLVASVAARRRGGGRHGDPERGRPLTTNESQRHARRLRAGRLLLGRVGDLRLRRRPRLLREPARLAG